MSSSSSTSSDNNPTTSNPAANALAYSAFSDPLLLSAVGNQTNTINSFPACYVPMFLPDSKFPRQLTRRTVKLWQRLILAYAVMEIYDLGKLSASVRIELCPECFNKHAKMVMEFYKDYIPQKVSYSDFISADAKGTPVRGNNIWEIWQEASHTVLSRFMPIWRRVVPAELQEGTHPAKRYEPYLLELRKELFEINDEVAQAQSNGKRKGSKDFKDDWYPLEWLPFLLLGPLSPKPFSKWVDHFTFNINEAANLLESGDITPKKRARPSIISVPNDTDGNSSVLSQGKTGKATSLGTNSSTIEDYSSHNDPSILVDVGHATVTVGALGGPGTTSKNGVKELGAYYETKMKVKLKLLEHYQRLSNKEMEAKYLQELESLDASIPDML